MAIAILTRWSMTYWPYHEWLADSTDELHLFTAAAKLDLPEPERERALARYASVHTYDNLERNARALLDIADLARQKPLKALVAQAEWDIGWAGGLRDRLRIRGQDQASALAYKNKLMMKEHLRAPGRDHPRRLRPCQPVRLPAGGQADLRRRRHRRGLHRQP